MFSHSKNVANKLNSPKTQKPIYYNYHEDFYYCVKVTLESLFNKNTSPSKILALDLDETLYDSKKSKHLHRIYLINEKRMTKLLAKAVENNIMVVIVTSRVHSAAHYSGHHIYNILNRFGISHFNAVYFTNSQPKDVILNKLYQQYFPNENEHSKWEKICLVDNSFYEIQRSKKAGFRAINVDTHNIYLDRINEFLNTSSLDDEDDENSQNKMRKAR